MDERSVEDLLTFINGGDGGICEKLSPLILIANACLCLFPTCYTFIAYWISCVAT